MLSCGIVGLPNSGKSTLFNALLSRQMAQVANYPFTTIEPNVGIVPVPDERLTALSRIAADLTPISADRMIQPPIIPATVEFIDIAGLIRGAHQGEGLGNQFLAKIREVSLVVHIVRFFTNPDVPHYYETIDPARDIEIVNLELELGEIKKPTLYVLNVDEDAINRRVEEWTSGDFKNLPIHLSNHPFVQVCAKLEMDLAELSEGEKREYLKELGVKETGLDKLIRKAYEMLGLITFYTIKGGKEVRAWSLKNGETALSAAAEVHTDMAKGFVKAGVVSYEDLVAAGGWQKVGELGKIRLEGRDYEVQDGDVIELKFSV
ncbi:YchF family ATPase [Candidatus Shapirobacteria bacterium]|nr:YchF family ATPase [Candidatus Shapirobacteria bacterium]